MGVFQGSPAASPIQGAMPPDQQPMDLADLLTRAAAIIKQDGGLDPSEMQLVQGFIADLAAFGQAQQQRGVGPDGQPQQAPAAAPQAPAGATEPAFSRGAAMPVPPGTVQQGGY